MVRLLSSLIRRLPDPRHRSCDSARGQDLPVSAGAGARRSRGPNKCAHYWHFWISHILPVQQRENQNGSSLQPENGENRGDAASRLSRVLEAMTAFRAAQEQTVLYLDTSLEPQLHKQNR